MDYFYPTDVLVTSREIIYLWVARMIFSSLEYLDKVPFHEVYIYATVLNEEGKRMSKSLGTGVDPLELIETLGADALRFALIQQTGKNQDIRFSDKRVENIRNFGNKIWNASRFVIMNLEGFDPATEIDRGSLRLEDRWILSRLNRTIDAVNTGFTNYDMDDSARALYEFMWSEFCDWYIELAKPRLRGKAAERAQVQAVLSHVLETTLRLLHPVMPFITEEIWQVLPHEGESIMIAPFPDSDASLFDDEAEAGMSAVMDAVRAVRNLRSELNIPPSKSIDLTVVADGEIRRRIQRSAEALKFLARVGDLSFAESIEEGDKSGYMSAHLPGLDLSVEVGGLVDIEKELARIDFELASIEKDLARSKNKLASEQFTSRAPAQIVDRERKIAAELEEKKAKLEERKAAMAGV